MPPQEFGQRFSVVRLRIVQKSNDGAVQVSQHFAQENANFLLPNVVEVELIEEAQMLAFRTDGNS